MKNENCKLKNEKTFLRSRLAWAWRGLVFWLAVMICGHAIVLNEPFVNQEVAFSEGARGLAEPGYPEGLTRFWRHQVNPLGYSAITALFRSVLHLPVLQLPVLHLTGAFWTARLASLAGGALILVSGYLWFRKTGSLRADLFWLWGGVTTLCPLVWIFTGRGTADVLPVGILCCAFTACWLAEGSLDPALAGRRAAGACNDYQIQLPLDRAGLPVARPARDGSNDAAATNASGARGAVRACSRRGSGGVLRLGV